MSRGTMTSEHPPLNVEVLRFVQHELKLVAERITTLNSVTTALIEELEGGEELGLTPEQLTLAMFRAQIATARRVAGGRRQ